MYIPKHFEEPRVEVLHALMRARPLATLVTLSSRGLDANHIPLHLSGAPAPLGTLRGHVARENPIWRDLAEAVEALAMFHGPDAYVTPSWYPTKAETGRAVPTWNYVVAHAYGPIRVVDDASWLRAHLEALTAHNEAAFEPAWRVADAPEGFIESLLGAIVGIEIVVARLIGKCKLSQNQPARNQAGVVQGLRACPGAGALEIAALLEEANRARGGTC